MPSLMIIEPKKKVKFPCGHVAPVTALMPLKWEVMVLRSLSLVQHAWCLQWLWWLLHSRSRGVSCSNGLLQWSIHHHQNNKPLPPREGPQANPSICWLGGWSLPFMVNPGGIILVPSKGDGCNGGSDFIVIVVVMVGLMRVMRRECTLSCHHHWQTRDSNWLDCYALLLSS